MNYKIEFIDAINKSEEAKLIDKKLFLPFKKKLNIRKMDIIAKSCFNFLRKRGIYSSSQLVGMCAPIHFELYQLLKSNNVKCEITVGKLYWNGQEWMNHANRDELLRDMESPDLDSNIRFHTWITLSDGAVIDFTILADQLSRQGIVKRVEECFIYIKPNEFDPDHYYVPLLVGEEYLLRTGAVQLAVRN